MEIIHMRELEDGGAVVTFDLTAEEMSAAVSFAVFTWLTAAADAEIARNKVQ